MPNSWPKLPSYADWRETFETIHRWTQIVGKVRLALGPSLNHSWGIALYVTPRGLTTSGMPTSGGAVEIAFDFIDHTLLVRDANGREEAFDLEGMSVAEFHAALMRCLGELDVHVEIYPWPVEIPDPIERFDRDHEHASYDAAAVRQVHLALVQVERVFQEFRARFLGKASPVHFFWGGFDLAVTRFSGHTAPRHPGGAPNCPDRVMVEAYSHEVSSAGFWPGGEMVGEAAFYAYAYPEPAGFRETSIRPAAASYSADLGEFLLRYEAVRAADDPDAALMAFLESTYEAAADRANWDRPALERSV